MRSIKEIHQAMSGVGGYPTDEEILKARKFYDDLVDQMNKCPDLKGVSIVAVLHCQTFTNIARARDLSY